MTRLLPILLLACILGSAIIAARVTRLHPPGAVTVHRVVSTIEETAAR